MVDELKVGNDLMIGGMGHASDNADLVVRKGAVGTGDSSR